MRWFGDRRNETVLDMVHTHLELTEKAVKELYEMIQAVGEGSTDKKKYYESISQHEMKADLIRRAMVTELSNRNLYATERDDLMELVRAVDWVADWAREAARILIIIPFEKLPAEFKQAISNMCRENYNGVQILDECIKALSVNPKKALDLADKIELSEENIDDLYAVVREMYVEIDTPDFTRGSMILLNEFMAAIETVSDWSENTADIARAIAIRVI